MHLNADIHSLLLLHELACVQTFARASASMVQVTYDPSRIKYEVILDAFWDHIDPTQSDGQGGDRGSQYRTGIYTHTPEQKQAAEASLRKLQKAISIKGVQVRCCREISQPMSR